MIDTIRPDLCQMWEVPRGAAVMADVDGREVLALKAEQDGKDFVRHYLVVLDPRPGVEAAELVYADPEAEVRRCPGRAVFTPGPEAPAGTTAEPGALFRNGRSLFMKLREAPIGRHKKLYAYVDLSDGKVWHRQEKRVEAVYPGWSAALEAG